MDEDQVKVLRMLKDGTISVEEAEALLDALGDEYAGGRAAPETQEGPSGAGAGAGSGGDERPRSFEEPRGRHASCGAWGHPGWPPIGWELSRAVRAAVRSVNEGVRPSIREALRTLRSELAGGADRLSSSKLMGDLFGSVSASEEASFTHAVPAGGRLVVRNPRGDVRVARSADGDVHVRVRKQAWARDDREAREALSRARVTLAPRGAELALDVEPASWEPWQFRFRADLDVAVPGGTPLAVALVSGDIHVREVASELDVTLRSGDLEVETSPKSVRGEVRSGVVRIREAGACALRVAHGDVRLGAVAGPTEVSVVHGDVRLDAAGGDLRAEITHGRLRAGQVTGSARVHVVSGEVTLDSCTGEALGVTVDHGDVDVGLAGPRSAAVRVTSGDAAVRVRGLAPGARVDVDVVSGRADLTLAPEVRATLVAEARSGAVECAVPLRDATRSRTRVEGVHGAADAAIAVRTVSGRIAVTAQEAAGSAASREG
jgi:DUF4097 and DUF4098 domain-containing protein YvlB